MVSVENAEVLRTLPAHTDFESLHSTETTMTNWMHKAARETFEVPAFCFDTGEQTDIRLSSREDWI